MPLRLFAELARESPSLAEELRLIHREALNIWSEPQPGYIRPFTAHAEPHIAQVERNLDALTQSLQNSQYRLVPEEIFVLLGACYLHDIGMLLEAPDARARHAEYAYELILYSFATTGIADRRVTLPITDPNSRVAIAQLARAHWTDFARKLSPRDFLVGNFEGRLRLLGALLATADLLDLSPVRAWRFRTIHRLSELPPLSELHQVLHARVKGFQISPPNPIFANELQFQLAWRDDSEVTANVADWIRHWLTSQWRQLQPLLKLDSNDQIRWAGPWISMRFEAPQGPIPELSSESLRILRAERMEQLRIDREEFAKDCDNALASGEPRIYILPVRPDFDGRHLCDWLDAWAHTRDSCLVGRVDVPLTAPVELASLVAGLMEQWGEHLPESDDSAALRAFNDLLESRTEMPMVLIVVAEEFYADLLTPLMQVFFATPDGDGVKRARIAVLATESAISLTINGVGAVRVADQPIPQDELDRFLQQKLGYPPEESSAIFARIASTGLQSKPGYIYSYIDAHCT